MRKMDYYFRTEKLSVGYRNAPLIEDITIGLNKGEILTLIGPNGAGKSTILKSIAKQLKPMGGVVYLDEKNTGELSGKELSQKMAVVSGQTSQTHVSVQEVGKMTQVITDIANQTTLLSLNASIDLCFRNTPKQSRQSMHPSYSFDPSKCTNHFYHCL